jgi:hypothetical protein
LAPDETVPRARAEDGPVKGHTSEEARAVPSGLNGHSTGLNGHPEIINVGVDNDVLLDVAVVHNHPAGGNLSLPFLFPSFRPSFRPSVLPSFRPSVLPPFLPPFRPSVFFISPYLPTFLPSFRPYFM